MHRPSWMWIRYSVIAVVLGAALAAPAGAATPDAWITTKIKLALLTTEGVSGTAIKVDTVAGQVTLYGRVHSAEEKVKAETIARKVEGVQGVRNLLQVVAPQHEKAMQMSDDDLKQRVEQTLQSDPSLKCSVTLGRDAPTRPARSLWLRETRKRVPRDSVTPKLEHN